MDNEPEETQQFSTPEPPKPSLRQRARDRWSALSDRMRMIAIIAVGFVIFIVGFGSGLAVDGGGHHRGGPCQNERSDRHHHQRYRDCYNQPGATTTAPTTTAPATTAPATTTPAAPTSTP